MITLVNFADNKFRSKQKWNTFTGKLLGGFDQVVEYGPTDLEKEFIEQHKNILSQPRGGGYWLWKPYLILKTLERLDSEDYLFYCDSGAIFLNSIKRMISEFEKLNQPIIAFQQPLIEMQWTKRKTFDIIGVDFANLKETAQLYGGYIFIKKSPNSLAFFKELLELSSNEKALINTAIDVNCPEFIDHRHDQSIFSLLYKKYSYEPLGDLSDYGLFPEAYCQPANRLVAKTLKYPNYAGTILSVRGANPVLYTIKYLIKRFIKRVFPSLYQKIFNKRKIQFNYAD